MSDRYVVSSNNDHAILLKNYFTFRDMPNKERVNNLKAYHNSVEDFIHIKIDNGRDALTGDERYCQFRMDIATAKIFKKWLDNVIKDC